MKHLWFYRNLIHLLRRLVCQSKKNTRQMKFKTCLQRRLQKRDQRQSLIQDLPQKNHLRHCVRVL